MKKILIALLVLFSLTSFQASADDPSEEQKRIAGIEKVMQSTVKIAFKTDQNELHTTLTVAEGSGFFVSGDKVLTAWHVVSGQGAKEIEVTTYQGREWQGKSCKATIGYREEALDLALLTVDCKGTPLDLAKRVNVGQDVFLGGSPASLDWIVTQGIVSRVIEEGTFKHIIADIDADHGNSGGPLFDSEGLIVGVANAINKKGPYLMFATHLEDVRAFLQRSGIRRDEI